MIVSIESNGINIDGRFLSRVSPSDIPIGVSSAKSVTFNTLHESGYSNGLSLDSWWSRLADGGELLFPASIKGNPRPMKAVNYFASRNGIIPQQKDGWISIKKTERRLVYGRCLLVGNGPSLQGGGNGCLIDSFETVIRFNNYVTKGHEGDVGSKTDIWCCYGKNASTPRSNPPSKIINLHGAVNDPSWYEPIEIWRIPVSFYHKVRDEIRQKSSLPKERRDILIPSSGLTLMLWLLEQCITPVVHYCGFDHFDRASTGGRHHYWMASTHTESMEHDGQLEKALIEAEGSRCVRI